MAALGKRIFIVEDDESIRELIRMALGTFSYEVSAFANAEDALSAVFGDTEEVPDMLIFDIMLPGMSGLEATEKIRSNPKTRDLPIIMLTAKETEFDKITGLDVGADDYIVKPFSVMELAARIRSVFRRTGCTDQSSEYISQETIKVLDLSINPDTREVIQAGKQINLTFKEYELLHTLVKERNRVLSRDELLSTIWGFDFVGESRTLDIHVRTLRQKLGDDAENPKYIKTVRNVGYRFIGDAKK